MTYIYTKSGTKFDYINTTADMINFDDIAHVLNKEQRFGNHMLFNYSVADHTYHCLTLAEKLGFTMQEYIYVLLHDFSEAYMRDIPSPLKQLIPRFSEIEDAIQLKVYEKFGIKPPNEEQYQKVKLVDYAMLYWEGLLLTGNHDNWTDKYKEYADQIDYEFTIEELLSHKRLVEKDIVAIQELYLKQKGEQEINN